MIPGSFSRLIAAAVASGFLFGCAEKPPAPKETASFSAVDFTDLPGWTGDDPFAALAAFQRSCAVFAKSSEDTAVGPQGIGGTAKDWQGACAAIPAAGSSTSARNFFEQHFTPYSVIGAKGTDGFFTGYYEPELAGSRQRSAEYSVPLYRKERCEPRDNQQACDRPSHRCWTLLADGGCGRRLVARAPRTLGWLSQALGACEQHR